MLLIIILFWEMSGTDVAKLYPDEFIYEMLNILIICMGLMHVLDERIINQITSLKDH